MRTSRFGFWSSVVVLAIGVAYIAALAAGFARHGLREPITDPVLAVMEILTLCSAPALVVMVVALCERVAQDRKTPARIALVFITLFAGTTMAVHFVELTAARQTGRSGIVWPSTSYAAELLAWDVFLGLALVFLAMALAADGAEGRVRRAMQWCGWLCLIGTVGPLVGDMRIQLVGVFGYAVVLPVVAWWGMRVFGEGDAVASGRPSVREPLA